MRRIVIGVAALSLVLAACASAAEVLTEQVAEQVVGGDVKIDTESGQVSVETEDGSVTIGGGAIPDGFGVPFPGEFEVTSVFTSDESEAVSVVYPGGDFDEIVAFYEDWTGGQDIEWQKTTSSISGDNGSLNTTNWTSDVGIIVVRNLCLVADESIDPEDCVGVNASISDA